MSVRWSWIGAAAVTFAASAAAQPSPSAADPAPPAGAPALRASADARDAAMKPTSRQSPYTATMTKGHRAMAAHDFAGAIAAYRAAVAETPRAALPLYFLGEAQTSNGELSEAAVSYESGVGLAAANDDLHGRLLFVLADLRERQGNWAEARRGWENYAQFLAAHPAVKGYATTATERSNALTVHVDLEASSAAVKDRIEQRAKAPRPGAADPSPAAAAKKK
jgi:tetratricopeptide (TPR) repeat protein